MSKYTISTDSAVQTIEASDIDAAAQQFDRRVKTMDQLVAKVTGMDGWITVTEDGGTVVQAGTTDR
ncbi:MAG: hypothetical protein E6Q97_04605 [Desulfurellales bacterium]|nr:MAG: hypothetical protein E6Q97_04605 [Desulfurellales bacterium]